jgi:hypothetical protein
MLPAKQRFNNLIVYKALSEVEGSLLNVVRHGQSFCLLSNQPNCHSERSSDSRTVRTQSKNLLYARCTHPVSSSVVTTDHCRLLVDCKMVRADGYKRILRLRIHDEAVHPPLRMTGWPIALQYLQP